MWEEVLPSNAKNWESNTVPDGAAGRIVSRDEHHPDASLINRASTYTTLSKTFTQVA